MGAKKRVVLVGNPTNGLRRATSMINDSGTDFEARIVASVAEVADLHRQGPFAVVVVDADESLDARPDQVEALRAMAPTTHLILISLVIDDAIVAKALHVGAKGLIRGDNLQTELLPALNETTNGGAWFPEEVRRRITVEFGGASIASRWFTQDSGSGPNSRF